MITKLAILMGTALAGLAAYLMLSSVAPPGIPYTNARAVAQGAGIYAAHCAACHGADREGQPFWQYPDVEGYLPAPPLNGSGHSAEHPDIILIETIRQGPQATVCVGRNSRMGGYKDILSDEEILAVLAHIKNGWPEEVIEKHNRVNGRPG